MIKHNTGEHRTGGRPIYWRNWLTLDNTVCVFCFKMGLREPLLPVSVYAEIVRLPRARRISSLQTRRRAAFRVHMAEAHPADLPRIAWSR